MKYLHNGKFPKIRLAGGWGRVTQIASGKRSLHRLRAVVVRAGHQAPTLPMECRRFPQGAVGTNGPEPQKLPTKTPFRKCPSRNGRGVRGDLAIGRCPGGTRGSLTPREDRRSGRARLRPTPPTRPLPRNRRPPHGSRNPGIPPVDLLRTFVRALVRPIRPRSTDGDRGGHARPSAIRYPGRPIPVRTRDCRT
jgi:hypothetical protein